MKEVLGKYLNEEVDGKMEESKAAPLLEVKKEGKKEMSIIFNPFIPKNPINPLKCR